MKSKPQHTNIHEQLMENQWMDTEMRRTTCKLDLRNYPRMEKETHTTKTKERERDGRAHTNKYSPLDPV